MLGPCLQANVATHRSGCSFKPASAITLRHVGTLRFSDARTRGPWNPPPGRPASAAPGGGPEGRSTEQRDTVRRHRRYLGWRAHSPVAPAGFLLQRAGRGRPHHGGTGRGGERARRGARPRGRRRETAPEARAGSARPQVHVTPRADARMAPRADARYGAAAGGASWKRGVRPRAARRRETRPGGGPPEPPPEPRREPGAQAGAFRAPAAARPAPDPGHRIGRPRLHQAGGLVGDRAAVGHAAGLHGPAPGGRQGRRRTTRTGSHRSGPAPAAGGGARHGLTPRRARRSARLRCPTRRSSTSPRPSARRARSSTTSTRTPSCARSAT